ncbi:MAG: CRISPR-associated endonuclease Cas1 [Chthoniobacterales bacterium]|nr:CRISPR-associated endonuclease Cas1 [Chthoniobacterales bacterium]
MIHHLVLLGERPVFHIQDGKLVSGSRRIAIQSLGSVQCFSAEARWSQSALEFLSSQCPCIMARWDKHTAKWRTFSLARRARHVNPDALWRLCRLSPPQATQLANALLWTKVCNQHQMLRSFDPLLPEKPRLKENSFSRILRLEAQYSRYFWPRYFSALSDDLFQREKRKPTRPLNAALNYGYGFLYHAIEWQCLASGLEPTVGLIHRLRRNRPSLVCDLIEPLRCTVELTVVRHLDQVKEPRLLAGRFAEMLETPFRYRDGNYRLRTIIRLMVESFVASLSGRADFHPFVLHARDACV